MPKDYTDITRSVSASLRGWRRDRPAVVNAFNGLSEAALADGALDKKTKELIACLEPNRRVELEAVGSVVK